MATITGSKRLLDISANAMAASNNMTYGGLNVATEQYVSTQIANLVSSAPGTLDTLNELAAALGDDPNFATTMTNALAGKLSTSHDMTLTLNGDASGSATFTNMGNATLTVVVANDSHTHDGRYYTETEVNNLLAGKLGTSGKAADSNLLDGLDLHTGRNNEANKVVRTDGNGYVNFGWINTTSGNTTNTITDFYVNTNDGYIRKATKAHVKSQLGLGSAAYVATSTFDAAGSAAAVNDRIDNEVLPAIGDISLASLGYTGATNANYITNNNQLTNGAGYQTSSGSVQNATWISFPDGPRNLSDRNPNWNNRSVAWDFVNNEYADGAGTYAGVMTFSPWDGTTSSTGDSSYQLAFINETGVNASGIPGLRLRNGIDTTWNEWHQIWHSGNFSPASYLTTSGKAADSNLLDGINSTSFLRSDQNDTMSGVLTITGNNGVSKLRLEGTTPTIDLDDSDGDSFYIHVNSNNFYILTDRDGGGNYGNWETPHPLSLEADTNSTYLWGNKVGTAAYQNSTAFDVAGSASTAEGNAIAHADDRIENEVLPAIPTNNNQLTNGAGYLTSVPSSFSTTNVTVTGYIKGNGQQLVLNAGESHSYATGQTNEYIYLNAEQGLEINSHTGNWSGGWSTRKTAYLRGDQLTLDGEAMTKTNIQNFKTAYNNYITGIAVSGTTTKTITLTQRDGGTISANFTDLSGAGGDGNDFLVNGGFDPATEVLSLEVANQGIIEIPLPGVMTDTDTNTWRPIHDTPVNGATTTSISSNWAFDNVKTPVPSGAVFTDNNTTYSAGTGLTLSGTTFSVTAGTYAAASHNHTSLNLTGSIYNGNANYSIDLRDHSDRTWLRNQVGGWTFQSGTSGDDWTQSYTFYLPAAGTTANNVWAEFGQRDSNDAAAGRYRGLRIVKDTGSVADGDLRAGAIYIGTTRRDDDWTAAYNWGNHASAGYASNTDLGSVNDRIDNEVFPAIADITLASLGYTGATNANYITNNNQLTNGAGYITDGNTGWNNTYGFITASSTDTLTNKSGNISQWTNDSGYLTSIPTTLSGNRTIGGDLTVSGNQVITSGSNADVKFSVWSGTTYGIGMTSGVTYGALNDYAMTFCMNNDSDRGFWWGYSGQSKSAGAMSLTTGGVLTVASSITAGGDITAFSDIRVKENIQDLEGSLDKVTQLRGVSYNKIGSEEKSIGVIAQEIQEVLPEVVREGQDGMLSVAYGNITAVLIEAIKEQQDIIAQLEERIVDLENRM
jgi:hypothetical protein